MGLNDVTRSTAYNTEVVRQIAELLHTVCGIRVELRGGVSRMAGRATKASNGIIAIQGKVENDILLLVCVLARIRGTARISAEMLFRQLGNLGERGTRYRLIVKEDGHDRLLGVEVGIALTPLSMVRIAHLKELLERIAACGAAIREQLPDGDLHDDLQSLYGKISDYITPMIPLDDAIEVPAGAAVLGEQAVEYLHAAIPLAMIVQQPLEEHFMLSLFARISKARATATLGRIIEENITTRRVVELASRAPGVVVFPVHLLALGNSELYDMGSKLRAFYASMRAMGKGVILTGTATEMQTTLNGGQGFVTSPIEPVILRPPSIPLEALLSFAIDDAARIAGGLPRSARSKVYERVSAAIATAGTQQPSQFLPQVVRREISYVQSGNSMQMDTADFVRALSGHRETFSGVTGSVAAECSPLTRKKLVDTVTEPAFENYLNEHLLAQEDALGRLVERLQTEAMTRPASQPVRMLLEGTPATGKSEASRLIAERLGWERMVIDCSGIPDLYTLNSRLNGSARGIVNSHQPGLLEIASRHSDGIVVEVSDLDHATPQVRLGIADLFLMPLDAGVGQSSTGATYHCANMLIMFTVNLPGGKDESAYNAVGYQVAGHTDVQARVEKELGQMLSKAFLSRVGTPILFRPLSGTTLRTIASRELRRALTSALKHQSGSLHIEVQDAAAQLVVEQVRKNITSFGARVLLEHARRQAASACLRYMREGKSGTRLQLSKSNDVLVITSSTEEK